MESEKGEGREKRDYLEIEEETSFKEKQETREQPVRKVKEETLVQVVSQAHLGQMDLLDSKVKREHLERLEDQD